MPRRVIANPIINSAFAEPVQHYRFDDRGITSELVPGRRPSEQFLPVPPSAKNGRRGRGARCPNAACPVERAIDNHLVNQIRVRVAGWRAAGHAAVTPTTAALLAHWTRLDRQRRLFFCQLEAIETAIYLTEVAAKWGDHWIEESLRSANESANAGLCRVAFKMATGTGKTAVMAMLIAWHTLNKLANPRDARFADAFLIITPGITVRDRLRVLLPHDPHNEYRRHDLVPTHQLSRLHQATILIANYHAFGLRDRFPASQLTKSILASGGPSAFVETPGQMVRRVCRGLAHKRNIIVLNDEAHHCYGRNPADDNDPVDRRSNERWSDDDVLTADDRAAARQRSDQARVWLTGIEAVHQKLGLRAIYDFSATPYFLRGSGYPEGKLFPWVVSDFSLIDAIESGIVKTPRIPTDDDVSTIDEPAQDDLWLRIRDRLPSHFRRPHHSAADGGAPNADAPQLPGELESALRRLYRSYSQHYRHWEEGTAAKAVGTHPPVPPVLIVVCNNTAVSKLVFDWIAGCETNVGAKRTSIYPGHLPLFRNDDGRGRWRPRPNTILIDSRQLDSPDALSPKFKRIAAREIEQFRADYCRRFPGRDARRLTDADLLREVLNTVGQPGRLGEHVRCIVSVAMLTEGWDACNVTHILGVRAFTSQLLCEQVVGRALRRRSYAVAPNDSLAPEFAEIFGVPFTYIPCAAAPTNPGLTRPRTATHVRAISERNGCAIFFPRVIGYRYELATERLDYCFDADSHLTLRAADVRLELSHPTAALRACRRDELAYHLARHVLDRHFRDPAGRPRPWLFPRLLAITRHWLADCLHLDAQVFPQHLLLPGVADEAADRIRAALRAAPANRFTLQPVVDPLRPCGSTHDIDFSSTRPVYPTSPDKCHASHITAHPDARALKLARILDTLPEVVRYTQTTGLDFTVPCYDRSIPNGLTPDFIVELRLPPRDGRDRRRDLPVRQLEGSAHRHTTLHLLLSLTRFADNHAPPRTNADSTTADPRRTALHTLWLPAVNIHGVFGQWRHLEFSKTDVTPRLVRRVIRHALASCRVRRTTMDAC